MNDPLQPLRALKEHLNDILAPLGLVVRDGIEADVCDDIDSMAFDVIVTPEAVSTEDDREQLEVNQKFDQMMDLL